MIVGGESGPDARPCDLAWIRSVVKQCKTSTVPVFVKQLGAQVINSDTEWQREVPGRVHLRDKKGGDMTEWPEDLRVREFPTVPR